MRSRMSEVDTRFSCILSKPMSRWSPKTASRLSGMARSRKVAPSESLGDRIKRFRLAKGITQTDLGALVGVTQRVITYYEVEGSPGPDMIVKLADALGITTDELLGRKAPSARKLDTTTKHLRLLRQFKRIEQLHPEDRRMVLKMIDTLAERTGKRKTG